MGYLIASDRGSYLFTSEIMSIGMPRTTSFSIGGGSVDLNACIPQGYTDFDVVLAAGCSRSGSTVTFGHGFLIASDSLTKHPSGPVIQPAKKCQKNSHHACKNKQSNRKKGPNHSAQLFPSHHQPSSLSHSES